MTSPFWSMCWSENSPHFTLCECLFSNSVELFLVSCYQCKSGGPCFAQAENIRLCSCQVVPFTHIVSQKWLIMIILYLFLIVQQIYIYNICTLHIHVWSSCLSWWSQYSELLCSLAGFQLSSRPGGVWLGYLLFTPNRKVDHCLHSSHPPWPQLSPTHLNWDPGLGFEPESSWASGFKNQLL